MKNLLQLTAVLVLAGTLSVQATTITENAKASAPITAADVNPSGVQCVFIGEKLTVDGKSNGKFKIECTRADAEVEAFKAQEAAQYGNVAKDESASDVAAQ